MQQLVFKLNIIIPRQTKEDTVIWKVMTSVIKTFSRVTEIEICETGTYSIISFL